MAKGGKGIGGWPREPARHGLAAKGIKTTSLRLRKVPAGQVASSSDIRRGKKILTSLSRMETTPRIELAIEDMEEVISARPVSKKEMRQAYDRVAKLLWEASKITMERNQKKQLNAVSIAVMKANRSIYYEAEARLRPSNR